VESDRLKAIARSESATVIDLLRDWWQSTTGKPDDERPFIKQPPGALLLRFYRASADQLRQLKAKGDKDFAELQEMDRLERMLEPDVDETYVQRLERAWRGTLTTSGDPVWDQWLANVRDGVVPSDWWGPLKDGVKG
jgi:hypothetical protein